MDSTYITAWSKGVIGFTISIDSIEGKAKLSQNHSKERVELVIETLSSIGRSDERAIAMWMQKKSLPIE